VRSRLAFAFLFAAAIARADQPVTIGPGLSFTPATVTVAPGEAVVWTWAAGPHSTTGDATTGPELWDSGVRFAGASFSHTFTTPGAYPYHCLVHSFAGGTAMNGVVQVVAPTATPTPSPTPTVVAPTPTPTPAGAGVLVPDLGPTGRLTLALGILLAALWLLRATQTR
jgi:plastocyanin